MQTNLLDRFVCPSTFDSWEEFRAGFGIKVPEKFNFGFDVVDEYARVAPSKTALVWCDDNGGDETFSFADVSRESNRIANFLSAVGVRKGDAVMLMLKRRYEFWFCLVALHKLGAVAVPASHMLTAKDITYRNNAADIKMIIAVDDEQVMRAVDDSGAGSPSLKWKVAIRGERQGWYNLHKEMEKASTRFERPVGEEATTNDDTLVLFFTSGTTGMPKMVRHDHTYPLGHILTAKYWQNVVDGGLHLTVADTGWAKSAWGKIYGQWIAGSAVMVYDYDSRFDAASMLRVLDKYPVTTFCGPATVYRMMVKENCSLYDLSSLKYCVVAGEPLYPEVFNLVRDCFGLNIMEGYGQSEGTVMIANYPWMEPRPGSMGKPSPNYDIDLLNERGESCGVGEEGHVVVRTHNGLPVGMFREYYRSPEQTEAAWRDGVYYTGDIARRDEDGYYWYIGRADDAIKSSGYKIGPFEVESVLQEHPAVLECAVTGVPDPIRGQIVKATIVLAEGYAPSEELAAELQVFVKTTTAPYKYPRIVEFVDALPKTVSGKVSRAEIRKGSSGCA